MSGYLPVAYGQDLASDLISKYDQIKFLFLIFLSVTSARCFIAAL